MWSRNFNCGALLTLVFFTLVLDVQDAHAERGRVFGRRPSSSNRGNAAGTGQQIPGFASLLKVANNEFNIGADGRLGVQEQRADGSTADLFLGRDGQVTARDRQTGRFTRPETRTSNDLAQFLPGGAQKSNRPGRIREFVARQTGNRNAVNGLLTIDLSSILPEGDSIKAGSPEQLQYALAVYNNAIHNLTNSSVNMRATIRDVRRDAQGRFFIQKNVSRGFNQNQLAIMAAADPTFKCTGKMRLQTFVSAVFDSATYYRIKGIEGFNRDQIFNALGVEGDPKRTLNNKILIAGDPGQGAGDGRLKESGVTTSSIGRVAKRLNQRRRPGLACLETDDFIDRAAPGGQTNGRDVKQVGILYTPDARETLCQQSNGYMLGMLFNAAGVLQTEAPANIATGGNLGPAVSATISCMDCHARGFLSGGRKISHDPTNFYKDNFNAIPNTPTAFANQFGQQVRHRDFFTTNSEFRKDLNVRTQTFFRALARTGGLMVGTDGYPMPVVPMAVARQVRAVSPADMAREQGVSEETMRAVVGTRLPALANRKDWDNAFCGIRNQLRSGSTLADRGQTSVLRGGTLGFQHNPNAVAGTPTTTVGR